MTAPIDKVRGEGNCGRVTDRGEEACECARKCRPEIAAGRILTSAARLRTETSSKAGVARRVSTTSRLTPCEGKPLPWKRPLVRCPDRDVPHWRGSRSQPGVGSLSFPRPQRSTIPTSKRLTRGDSGSRLESFLEPPYADPHVRWCGGAVSDDGAYPTIHRSPWRHRVQCGEENSRSGLFQ